jgi:hypothetical protein
VRESLHLELRRAVVTEINFSLSPRLLLQIGESLHRAIERELVEKLNESLSVASLFDLVRDDKTLELKLFWEVVKVNMRLNHPLSFSLPLFAVLYSFHQLELVLEVLELIWELLKNLPSIVNFVLEPLLSRLLDLCIPPLTNEIKNRLLTGETEIE